MNWPIGVLEYSMSNLNHAYICYAAILELHLTRSSVSPASKDPDYLNHTMILHLNIVYDFKKFFEVSFFARQNLFGTQLG